VSEELAKAVARRLGVGEEDARLALSLFSEFSEGEDVEKAISLIAAAGQGLEKAPAQFQQAVAPVVATALLKQLSRDPYRERLVALAESLMTIKALLGQDETARQLQSALSSVVEQINRLNQEIESLKEVRVEEVERSLQPILSTVESLRSGLEELRRRLDELSRQPRQVSEEVEELGGAGRATGLAERLRNDITTLKREVEGLADVLSMLGYKVVRSSEPTSPPRPEELEELRRRWEALGYEVKPKVVTVEELNRLRQEMEEARRRELEELRRRYKELLRRKLARSEKIAEARTKQAEMAFAVLMKLMDAAIAALSGGVQPKELEVLRQIVGGQGGGQGSGEGSGGL